MSLTVSEFNRKAKRRRGDGQRDEMERVGGDGETSERRNEKSWRRRENVVNHAYQRDEMKRVGGDGRTW